jgi:hypothetical protein
LKESIMTLIHSSAAPTLLAIYVAMGFGLLAFVSIASYAFGRIGNAGPAALLVCQTALAVSLVAGVLLPPMIYGAAASGAISVWVPHVSSLMILAAVISFATLSFAALGFYVTHQNLEGLRAVHPDAFQQERQQTEVEKEELRRRLRNAQAFIDTLPTYDASTVGVEAEVASRMHG